MTWQIDTKIYFDLPGGNVRVWVQERYPRFYYESLREIDCGNFYYRFIGCTRYSLERKAEGPCFTPGMYTSWMNIEAGTYEDELHAVVCGRPASTDETDPAASSSQQDEEPSAEEPYR